MTLKLLNKLLDDLDKAGLIDDDTTYEEFEELMTHLEGEGHVVD